MKYILCGLPLILLIACSGPKSFRKLSGEEKIAIKSAQKGIDKSIAEARVLILTDSGNMVVRLYNATPLHRDNFLSKVQSGFYDSLLFHRVINNFMIQGGDPNSKNAIAGQPLGGGSAPGGQIKAEFRTDQGIYHKRGSLAAARNDNPEKASSNCQFYIVQHKPWRPAELDSFASQREITLNDNQKAIYTSVGGSPHLDGEYTVFGILENGMEGVDKIALTPKAANNRPLKPIPMRMFVVYLPKSLKKK